MTTARDALTIGLDLGTSALKAVALDAAGRIRARAGASYPLATPRPGWSEQDPEDWWRAARDCLARIRAATGDAEILGLGLSGQMHGSVFLDAEGAVIRPALLWNDARTGAQCAEIERRLGRARVLEITGNRPSAGFQAPKILWLAEQEPEAHARIARVLLPKDFLRLRLTGTAATDAADASGTLLLDIRTRDYSPEMLDALEIPRSWLPPVHEGPEIVAHIDAAGAAASGLPEGLPVVAGGGDNACAAIGAGIVAGGDGVCSIGTSGTLFVHAERAVADPEGGLNAFCAAVPGGWHLMGVVLSAGGALAWFAEKVLGETAAEGAVFDRLFAEIADLPAGAEGLLFLPYLAGERSPHMDPDARGAWVGLSLAHDRRHMARALVEGVGFAFADCLARMRDLGLEPRRLLLAGGGARNPRWREILAAQLDRPLLPAAAEDGPALGAAMLAGVGTGMFADFGDAVARCVPAAETEVTPAADAVAAYGGLLARYRKLYPALAGAGLFGER